MVALGWSPRVPGGQRGAEPPACAETEPGAGLREAGPDGGKGALSGVCSTRVVTGFSGSPELGEILPTSRVEPSGEGTPGDPVPGP